MEPTNQLSAKLLARRWGLSPRTLDRWRRTGRGPCYAKRGGRVTYQLSNIQA
jgi:predicted site-specific integrase-resolvase